MVDLRPRITNGLSDAQAVSETFGVWSVVIDSAVRSFVRRMTCLSLFSCPASWGRESLAHDF